MALSKKPPMNDPHVGSRAAETRPVPTGNRVRWLGCGLLLVATMRLLWWADAPEAAPRPKRPVGVGPRARSGESRLESASLEAACGQTSRWIARQLGEHFNVVVHAPFVLAGDLTEEALHSRHRLSIAPAARAMGAAYFCTAPNEPITILLFDSEQSYRRHAERLFGDRNVSRFGYYRPHLRVLVINAGTGRGPLWHELTHALMAFDFPDAPDWFAEGLASLHESGRVRSDGLGIEGDVNWRLPVLKQALREGRLRSIESLLANDDFRGPDKNLNYAHARHVCLYLQRNGMLRDFYRRLRESRNDDPSGRKAVREVFPDRSWEELDADFRRFVQGLES